MDEVTVKKVVDELPIKEMYTDLLKPSISRLGKTGEDILKFVALPFRFLGMTADELEKKYKMFICSALNKIPEEKREKPSALIAGPLLEHVKYIFNEEQEQTLVKMFAELLGNASSKDMKEYVQPSYVYTLRQLTWIEAEILKLIYEAEADKDCLGIAFSRFNKTNNKVISVFSDEAEPLIEAYEDNFSNVFYKYNIPIIIDELDILSVTFKKALNILIQLNLVNTFIINKYKDDDIYSLDKHDKNHTNEFDYYKKIEAYTLTSYGNDIMELCIAPEDDIRACFKCNDCHEFYQNINKKNCCPNCKSKNVVLKI